MQLTQPPVIIENSSFTCRAGLESEKDPSVCIPTIVAEKRINNQLNILVGNQISDELEDYKLFYPIQLGMIIDWQRMECIWQHIFEKELKVQSEHHPTLITQAPRTPKHIKEKMAEIMFEKFQVPFFHVSNQSVLSLYSSGRTTGTVLESGDGVTYSLPIYEGYIMKHNLQRLDIGGRNCSFQLIKLINNEKINSLNINKKMKIINEIKEMFCYVALDPEKEDAAQKIFYQLPDGSEIVLRKEVFQCTEILFKPEQADIELPGIHQIVQKSIKNCDFDLWEKLYDNILLSGGNCQFSGLQERLQLEMSYLSPSKVRIISHPNRLNSAWLGGSILSTLSTFQSFWVKKSEYEEIGPKAIFIKCF